MVQGATSGEFEYRTLNIHTLMPKQFTIYTARSSLLDTDSVMDTSPQLLQPRPPKTMHPENVNNCMTPNVLTIVEPQTLMSRILICNDSFWIAYT